MVQFKLQNDTYMVVNGLLHKKSITKRITCFIEVVPTPGTKLFKEAKEFGYMGRYFSLSHNEGHKQRV
jgi:hypothetical protein